ncbi:MAG: hypothetical protein DSZ05_03705 [Sulfurospirillum sp.]|nr:MAG: hypothetical protein DSZ05_03705 [Sulfurospirillum sp.]
MRKNMSRRIIAIICIQAYICANLSAYTINRESLTPDRLYVQIAALKKKESIDALLRRMKRFPLWCYHEGEITKVIVVSNPRYEKAMLRKIHRYVPDAFVLSENAKNYILHISENPVKNIKKGESTINSSLPLNAQTILQTRKKFF